MALPAFEWPVDQAGYDVIKRGDDGPWDDDGPWIVQARGGPPRYYRPMEVEGLWRRFADQCADDRDGILKFVSEFGLLAAKPWQPLSGQSGFRPPVPAKGRAVAANNEILELIRATAVLIRKFAEHYEKRDRAAAADLFNFYCAPKLTVGIAGPDARGRFEDALIPADLRAALLLQTKETITANYVWRRCRNEGCPSWFRIGSGFKTARREFCSPRCRVADAARRKKSGISATEGK